MRVRSRDGTIRLAMALLFLSAGAAAAEEKVVVLDEMPRLQGRFKVAPDGSKLYFAGDKYAVFDARGQLIDQVGTPEGTVPRDLIPLPDGWFIGCSQYQHGHLALCRPDGTEAKVLVTKGPGESVLRSDMTGWTSPLGAAVDVEHRRIFVLDTTMAPAGRPDPDWSRIAMFDFDGRYLGDLNRYDGAAADKDDSRRTWYDDIAVDPARQRVYVTARRTQEVWAFAYDGKAAGKVSGGGALAVFPDGRIASGSGRGIAVYRPDFTLVRRLALPPEISSSGEGIRDLETDAAGRLYASVGDPTVTFLRWPADLEKPDIFGPRYQRLQVEFPNSPIRVRGPFTLKAAVSGRPEPNPGTPWQVLIRPSDGTDLHWQSLPVTPAGNQRLRVTPPGDLRGLYEVAVWFGDGPLPRLDGNKALVIQKTLAFIPGHAARSLAVLTSSGRRAFREGEAIPLQVIRGDPIPGSAQVELTLERDGEVIASGQLPVRDQVAVAIPPDVTRRLVPGRYGLRPKASGYESYALSLDIAPGQPDSPLQRILYHEFDQTPATLRQPDLTDSAERLSFIRQHVRGATELGFTRETDRLLNHMDKNGPQGWYRDRLPAAVGGPGSAPADFYAVPTWLPNWEAEFYLDQAVRRGLNYDAQLLTHCSGIRFRESWLRDLDPLLQRGAQWLGRFPSFYGFNYNDEMFVGGVGWTAEDDAWLKRVEAEKFPGRPHADTLVYALRTMYDSFNASVRQANPQARLTATPMWQFPAVEGSYAPAIYQDMSESYSHFLSEGYHYPWYTAHSAEFLRRPGLPLMGVFDNGYRGEGGEVYLKNVMQVIGRGVQGTGVEHTNPFEDPLGADAYRTANLLAQMYGPIFAEAPPANEAAVLYSYSQDVRERRNHLGTPHFERVYALFGAGLMAGVPMAIVYEEDVGAGWLLEGSRPRVPMLFLVGQTQPLPAKVREEIAQFLAAGGKVFTDADSASYPGGVRLGLKTHELKSLFHEGYGGDTIFPLFQPVLEKLASELAAAVGRFRHFPMDTDDPWVSKNQFDGGAVRYLAVASETSPYPWDAGTVWSLGTLYNKTYLPRTVDLTFPAGGVVYDVFDHVLVQPAVANGKARLPVDLTTFPGRLYALAPAPLGAPRISLEARGGILSYKVEVLDDRGRAVPARVPVRIRLHSGQAVAQTIFRGTGPDGTLIGELAVPATGQGWTLEATELLGGQAAAARVAPGPPLGDWLVKRPDVEPQRERQIRALLKQAKGSMTLVTAGDHILSAGERSALQAALKAQGIELTVRSAMPREVTPGVYLAAGFMKGFSGQGELLEQSRAHGLYEFAVSETVPGPGRGFFTAVFAPRGYQEHCVALVGGDPTGLRKTVQAFIAWLQAPQPATAAALPVPSAYAVTGKAAQGAPVPRLMDRIGVRLSGVTAAGDGKHLLLTADGYLRNLALVEDLGDQARIVQTARVGQAPTVGSAYVSANGKWFGASGRETARFGQGFHLVHAGSGQQQIFAAFGDIGRQHNRFAVSSTGDVVLAPGTCGVVCWRRDGSTWKEAWALDFWKEFNRLDWPVSNTAERIPQFQTVIPRGADYALILYGEFSDNGWVTPDNPCRAWLAAVNLADGKERWRFDVPILKTLLLPHLHTSPDGSRLLLEIQMGSWRKETYRFFSLANGAALASWNAPKALQSVALADATGRIAEAFQGRLLEVREPSGKLVYNLLWKDQPISLAFAADGQSLYVADDSGRLTRLGAGGQEIWHVDLGCGARLAVSADRLYAAGWDGRLRSLAEDGSQRWKLDCTPAMHESQPMAAVAQTAKRSGEGVWQAKRPPTTVSAVPRGENLLRTGQATLTVGGTPGWMSRGSVRVKADELTNGRVDDVSSPWLPLNEVFWDGQAGRQVWAEVAFKAPTDIQSLTVHENPRFPDSWPTEGLVQVWDDGTKKWNTAARSVFLSGPVNTYLLNLKKVTRLRYVPWNSYYRNFYTSEIEVR